MSENQNPETNENKLEDCSFQLVVKDGVTSLKVEGTLGSVSEALANAALQSPQLEEVIKMATFMMFQHHIAQQAEAEASDEDDVPAEASEILENLFGQMGQA
jgi:hypothetical protein